MNPRSTLLFLVAVLAALAALGVLWPGEGIRFAGIRWTLSGPQELLWPEAQERVDISAIVALPTDTMEVDSVATVTVIPTDTARSIAFVLDSSALPPLEERISLHYPNNDRSVLEPLFAALHQASARRTPLRVLHFGDSQIEGDRITSYLRHKFQARFGGGGPGLIPVDDIVPSFSVERSLSGDWQRHTILGKRRKDLPHGRFGVLTNYARFTPMLPDSVELDGIEQEASIRIAPLARAYRSVGNYDRCRIFLGHHRHGVHWELAQEGVTVHGGELGPSEGLQIAEVSGLQAGVPVDLIFRADDSPEVYGISLEASGGICMDNIGMRGSAAYEFASLDATLLHDMFEALEPRLVILQFGGNAMPDITDADKAERYGTFFGTVVKRFKRWLPNAAIIVIGPSDMSIKEGEQFITRPFLEEVNTAMKRNSLAQGAVYWDLYQAMGGRNSMVSWVEADPPLAATDYTHFSPQGARKVGELFWSAFINDYAASRSSKP
ncbi:MAG: GDSL-type esterase/lipase family protein [Flavobacteriales bacterium]